LQQRGFLEELILQRVILRFLDWRFRLVRFGGEPKDAGLRRSLVRAETMIQARPGRTASETVS
jgi:hypothetical protein